MIYIYFGVRKRALEQLEKVNKKLEMFYTRQGTLPFKENNINNAEIYKCINERSLIESILGHKTT